MVLNYGLLIVLIPDTAVAQTAQQIAKKGLASTVLLVMQDGSGRDVSLGSGFFVGDGEIASNFHVVKGASQGHVKLFNDKNKYNILGISAMDVDHDLVLLKISGPQAQSLSLGNSDDVQVGDPVYVIGNPVGLEATFSQGIVSSIRDMGSGKRLQMTAPVSPGSSGGPVLNAKGDVIGVTVATMAPSIGGQNLNFAVPANYLKSLLASAGPVKSFASVKSLPKQPSIIPVIPDPAGPRGKDKVFEEGTVVSIQYTLYSEDGKIIESNKGKEPLKYTQGSHQIVPGLEKNLAGMKVGEEKRVKVKPEEGYGLVDPKGFQEFPKEKIPSEGLKVGTVLMARGPQGQQVPVRVHEIKEKTVVLDLNHPMAGKTLVFDVKVLDIQPASTQPAQPAAPAQPAKPDQPAPSK